jgi:hypothetical protein
MLPFVGILVAACTAFGADDPAAARFRGTGKADPIRVENLKKAAGPAAGQTSLGFDVAWNHSWRARWEVPEQAHGGKGLLAVENWDAAWLFVKYRMPGADGWSHATLSANAADHAAPPAAKLDVGLSDEGTKGVGAFAFRSAVGSGPNDWKGVTLRWLHEADGVTDPAAAEVRVFAVHMVYVPEGAFWLGDGSTNFVAAQFSAGDSIAPYRVESEAAITLGGEGPKNLGNRDTVGQYFRTDDFSSGAPKTLPARFPKGHAAFYCMRHELTEGEIVAWLNTLSAKAQAAVQPFQGNELASSGIKAATPASPGHPAVYASDRPDTACDAVMWSDGTGYSTWAGLRPMTELEFEKACRGPLVPVADEYAWGTSAIAGAAPAAKAGGPQPGYIVAQAGTPAERVSWQGDAGRSPRREGRRGGGCRQPCAAAGRLRHARRRPGRRRRFLLGHPRPDRQPRRAGRGGRQYGRPPLRRHPRRLAGAVRHDRAWSRSAQAGGVGVRFRHPRGRLEERDRISADLGSAGGRRHFPRRPGTDPAFVLVLWISLRPHGADRAV